jgi:hypothetical protein
MQKKRNFFSVFVLLSFYIISYLLPCLLCSPNNEISSTSTHAYTWFPYHLLALPYYTNSYQDTASQQQMQQPNPAGYGKNKKHSR